MKSSLVCAVYAATAMLASAIVTPAAAQWGPSGMYGPGKTGLVTTTDLQNSRSFLITVGPEPGPLALPAWPARSTVGVTGDIRQSITPPNEFFPASDFTYVCDGSLVDSVTGTYNGMGEGFTTHVNPACKITKAPVVDMQWVKDHLDAQGYTYYIAYPLIDHGNGRALISWVKGCWLNDYAEQINEGAPYMCWAGIARLEGAGYVYEYDPFSYCQMPTTDDRGHPTAGCRYEENLPYGYATKNVATWPEPYRSTGVALMGWSTGKGQDIINTLSYILPIMHAWQDDWLGQPPAPPPLPPAPMVTNGPPPPPLNVGRSGNGYAQGQESRIGDGVQKDSGFDFVSFCNAPSNSGKPRSAAFIEACLAKAGQ